MLIDCDVVFIQSPDVFFEDLGYKSEGEKLSPIHEELLVILCFSFLCLLIVDISIE